VHESELVSKRNECLKAVVNKKWSK